MNTFMNALNQMANNEKVTENGALGYATTGKSLLDLNFSVPQLRTMGELETWNRFLDAYNENPELAMRWLFFLRDVRMGLGERKAFRVILHYLANLKSEEVRGLFGAKVMSGMEEEELIPFYGRWDDMLSILDTPLGDLLCKVIKEQLDKDLEAMENHRPCSLLAKWLPSVNASNAQTVADAKKIAKALGYREKGYRKTLSSLRGYINVIEKKISANKWDQVNYEAVPSKANLLYAKAFLRHDEERRREYIAALTRGEAKINSSVTFPHEILYADITSEAANKPVYEAMWKALPNIVDPNSRTIVVADGSGSMETSIPGSNVEAIHVANALAIYFAERLSGEFHDKYITFSMHPQLVDLSQGNTLYEKWRIARSHCEVANTNIEAVFDLILKTAVNNNMSQDELPANILIISDMEFDTCAMTNGCGHYGAYGEGVKRMRESRLMEVIKQRYEDHGYKVPRLIFWNVNSRTGTIPVLENDLGVALVSGYSVHIANMVMSGELDPYKCLVEQLMNERYNPVAEALKRG